MSVWFMSLQFVVCFQSTPLNQFWQMQSSHEKKTPLSIQQQERVSVSESSQTEASASALCSAQLRKGRIT